MSYETANVLRRAMALIDTPEKWCKGKFEDGEARCVRAAVYAVDGSHGNSLAIRALAKAAGLQFRTSFIPLAAWQDARARTHAEVMAAFKAAIEAEEAAP